MTNETNNTGSSRALLLSTTAFAVTFGVWPLHAALATTSTQLYNLSATEKSLMIAVPVLLGSVGRIFAGLAADKFGGRIVFAALLVFSAFPAIAIGFSTSFNQLLVFGLLLGVAGTTFPVGVGFTSRWFPPEKQGAALGVYGMGNIGQSMAVFGAPVLAVLLGDWRTVFFIFAAVTFIWGIVFYLTAKQSPTAVRPKTLAESLAPLKTSKIAWVL